MTGYLVLTILLALAVTAVLVLWLENGRRYLAGAQAVRDAEDDTWVDDEDEHFEEARRVLDAQRQYTCAFCGRNAGHNAGCPSVRRHRAVADGGDQQ